MQFWHVSRNVLFSVPHSQCHIHLRDAQVFLLNGSSSLHELHTSTSILLLVPQQDQV